MSQLKKLVGETAIYGISTILGRTLNFLLVPLYTTQFNPADYGVVTKLFAVVAFLNALYTYGMETAYFRFASPEGSAEKDIFRSGLTSITLTSIILSGLLALFATPLIEALQYPGKERYVYWFAAIVAIDAIVALPFARLRLNGKAKHFAVAKLLNIGVNLGLNLFFIVLCKKIYEEDLWPGLKPTIEGIYNPDYGIDYIFISNVVASALMLPLLSNVIFSVKPGISWKHLKPMLVYGYPILLVGLAYATNEMFSRIMLDHWLPEKFYKDYSNEEALGIFGAVYKLSIFMALGIQAFRLAAEPFFFSTSTQKDSPQLYAKIMSWFIIFGSFVFVAISLNLDIIQYILGKEEYRLGIHVVPTLLLANLIFGVYFNLSVWYKLSDKTYYGTIITMIGAIVTVVLNYLLIPVMGYEGSALVTLFTYILMTSISYILGRRHYPVPYKVLKGIGYLLSAVVITYAILAIDISDIWLRKALHLLVLTIFAVIIYLLEKRDLPRKSV
ncbi:MAG: oligosaccharide flippase family protein [Bacteroidota bacterium]